MGPNLTGVLIHRDKDMHTEDCVRTQLEGSHLQAKGRSQACLHLDLGYLSFQNMEEINLLFKSLFVVLRYGSSSKLIHCAGEYFGFLGHDPVWGIYAFGGYHGRSYSYLQNVYGQRQPFQ